MLRVFENNFLREEYLDKGEKVRVCGENCIKIMFIHKSLAVWKTQHYKEDNIKIMGVQVESVN
jgi:hypothetical protein